MANIELDDLLAASNQGGLKTVDEVTSIELAEKKAITLSPEAREQVERIKNEIDLKDSQASTLFAASAQKELSDFSASILKNVRNSDLGSSGQLLTNLLTTIQGFDVANLSEDDTFIEKIFRKGKNKLDQLFGKYEIVENQVDKISNDLQIAQNIMLKDISMYDKLYGENLNYFNELELYILAGEETIEQMRTETLPALRSQVEASNNPMSAQVLKDFEDNVNRFEKKIFDLKTSRLLAIQTAPQIKLIQNNDKLLVDKIQDTIFNTIPLWKSQMVIAFGLEHQGKIVAMQREISDTTNRLLEENAKKLKQNTLDVAREAERSTIDTATLQKANDDLISTIQESLKIHQEARTARDAAEKQLLKMEDDLKKAIMEAATSDTPRLEQ